MTDCGEDVALENYLREQERLLRWKADNDEDAIQEARIAVWQTLTKHPDATRSYLDQAATWRIRNVQRGDAMTGERRRGGVPTDPIRREDRATDDALFLVAAAESLEALTVAYHEGEILAAIAQLPAAHREYVVLRFWGGMDRNEIGARLGRNPGNLATTWRTQIAPVLVERLEHLRELV